MQAISLRIRLDTGHIIGLSLILDVLSQYGGDASAATSCLLPAAIHILACVAYQAEATGNPVRLYPGRGFCVDCPT